MKKTLSAVDFETVLRRFNDQFGEHAVQAVVVLGGKTWQATYYLETPGEQVVTFEQLMAFMIGARTLDRVTPRGV